MHTALLDECRRLQTLRPDLPGLRVDARINWLDDKPLVIHIEYFLDMKDYASRQTKMVWSLKDAEIFLLGVPGLKEVKVADFTRELAHLVERARDLGIPVVSDLEATMKTLSTNILTREIAA